MDKWISVILGANSRLTCGKKGYSPIDHHHLPTGLGRREGERKGRGKRWGIFRVRSSHFSLIFSGDQTVKLRRGKKQSWSTLQGLRVGIGIVEFQKLQEVWVSGVGARYGCSPLLVNVG